MQHMQVQSNKTEGRRIEHRNPVPPKCYIPPRGKHCDWLPIGKRELKSRAKSLNEQRLKVIEIIIKRTIVSILSPFALNIDGDISFTFNMEIQNCIEYYALKNKYVSKWDSVNKNTVLSNFIQSMKQLTCDLNNIESQLSSIQYINGQDDIAGRCKDNMIQYRIWQRNQAKKTPTQIFRPKYKYNYHRW